MVWDKTENSRVGLTRLRLSPPNVAYDALREYGASIRSDDAFAFSEADDELEQELAGRQSKLIELGLAEHGGCVKVVKPIYERSVACTDDAAYDKAIILAVLRNQAARGVLYDGFTQPNTDEIARLVEFADKEQIYALVSNPIHRRLLAIIYKRGGPFAKVSDERWFQWVVLSQKSPGLTIDEDGEDSPDMISWDIQKALWELLRTAPLEWNWVMALHGTLVSLNPSQVKGPKTTNEVVEVLNRWAGVKVRGYKEGEDQEGHYTKLTFAQEFCCLIGALYGRVLGNKEYVYVGSLDSDDVVMRCACYGNGKMTAEQMRNAQLKDHQTFYFAALWNGNLYQRECRVELEAGVSIELQYLYTRRCKQLAIENKYFDPAPVSEDMLADKAAIERAEPANAESVRALTKQVANLTQRVVKFQTTAAWAVVVIVLILVFRH